MVSGRTEVRDKEILSAVSGALAGGITATIVCPLDVLRTRLQVQTIKGGVQYRGLRAGITRIIRDEGVKGLYRGLSPTLVALIPNWAVYFFVYETLKGTVGEAISAQNTASVHVVSAAGAGAATLAATNPLWVVKTRLQTQDMNLPVSWPRYNGTFDALRQIVHREGVSRLYSGLAPSFLGILHVAVQFPLYEFAKSQLAMTGNRSMEELTVPELIWASAASKMVASTLTYPHEVIRSHMHVNGTGPFTGFVSTCRTIVQESGMRGFYRGCGVNLLRTVPAAAITFTSFELIARGLRRLVQRLRGHGEGAVTVKGGAVR